MKWRAIDRELDSGGSSFPCPKTVFSSAHEHLVKVLKAARRKAGLKQG